VSKFRTAPKRAAGPYCANAPHARISLALNCPKCGRGGEATISGDISRSAGHPDLVVHTISPESKVIKASIYWHRIMIHCTREEKDPATWEKVAADTRIDLDARAPIAGDRDTLPRALPTR
jgi:hypothetical protein